MNRVLLLATVSLAFCGAPQVCRAQDGLLTRLNRSLVPTQPGLPTASPLGLLAPRLSNAVSIFQFGGVGTPAGRLAALGVLSPRVSPVVGMLRAPSLTRPQLRQYGLTILSPRATALVGMLKGARGAAVPRR